MRTSLDPPSARPGFLLPCALGLVLCLGSLREVSDTNPLPFLLAISGAYLCYFVAAHEVLERPTLRRGFLSGILLVGVVLQAVAWSSPPRFDDDLYRYAWEGKVILAGESPYVHPPSSLELIDLWRKDQYRIPYDALPSPYPPLAQVMFAASAWLARESWPMLKAVFTLVFFGGTLACLALLRSLELPESRILLVAWSPLAAREVGNCGHLDALLVLLVPGLCLTLVSRRGQRPVAAVFALAGAILSKVWPLLLVPATCVLLRRRRGVLLLLPVLLALSYTPFRKDGWAIFDGLALYGEFWVFNPGPFSLLESLAAWLIRESALSLEPPRLARALSACLVGIATLATAWQAREKEPRAALSALFWPMAALLFFGPTVDPWYLLCLLPWLCVSPSRTLLAATALVQLSYFYYLYDRDIPAIRALEFGSLVAIAIREWQTRRAAPRAGASS